MIHHFMTNKPLKKYLEMIRYLRKVYRISCIRNALTLINIILRCVLKTWRERRGGMDIVGFVIYVN